MTVQAWQDVVYPVLVGQSLLMSALLVMTYIWVERTRIVLMLSLFFVAYAAAMFVLTMVTGDNPVLDINAFRPWIIRVRVIMVIVLIPCLYYQAKRLWRRQ